MAVGDGGLAREEVDVAGESVGLDVKEESEGDAGTGIVDGWMVGGTDESRCCGLSKSKWMMCWTGPAGGEVIRDGPGARSWKGTSNVPLKAIWGGEWKADG